VVHNSLGQAIYYRKKQEGDPYQSGHLQISYGGASQHGSGSGTGSYSGKLGVGLGCLGVGWLHLDGLLASSGLLLSHLQLLLVYLQKLLQPRRELKGQFTECLY
jgi:hypothetical protein